MKNNNFNKYLNEMDEMTDAQVDAYCTAAADEHESNKDRARKRRRDSRKYGKRRFADRSIYVRVPEDQHELSVIKGMCSKTQMLNSEVHGPNHPFEMGVGNKRRDETSTDKLKRVDEELMEVAV